VELHPIELVCFDLGGVLLRIADNWVDACGRAGVEVRDELFDESLRQSLPELSRRLEAGRVDLDTFVESVVCHSGYRPEQVLAVLDAIVIDLYPGTGELLDRLASKPVTTALLSNTIGRHWDRIRDDRERFGAIHQIAHHFVSHEIGHRKPEAAIYEHVEQALGVAPRHILYFDDQPENINAAVWHDWQTEAVDPKADTVAYVTRKLEEYGVL